MAGPAGWKGSFFVRTCQIVSASWRARSTRATLAPRWRPRRSFIRSYRSRYLGSRAAWVAASMSTQRRYVGPFLASGPRRSLPPDWADERTEPGVPAELLGAREAADVADL